MRTTCAVLEAINLQTQQIRVKNIAVHVFNTEITVNEVVADKRNCPLIGDNDYHLY